MAADKDVDNNDLDGNNDLNSILDEMGASKQPSAAGSPDPGASRSRSSADSKVSHIESLLSEVSAPSQTEAAAPATAPAPLNAPVVPQPEMAKPAHNQNPENERQQPRPASPLPLPRGAVWFVVAFLALNTVGILAIVGVFLMFSQRQRQGTAELASALQNIVQARRQEDPDDSSDKQAAADAEQAAKLFDEAQYEAALPLLQRSVAAFPDRSDLLWKSGVAAMQVQQWRAAVDSFRLYSENFPSGKLFYQSLANLATCYKQLGFYTLARRTLFRLIALSGRLPEEMRKLVPEAQLQIADCYAQEAAQAEKAASASSDDPVVTSRPQGDTDGQPQ